MLYLLYPGRLYSWLELAYLLQQHRIFHQKKHFFMHWRCCRLQMWKINRNPWKFTQKVRQYLYLRTSPVVRASDCQCTSCNGLGFDPSIRVSTEFRRHGIPSVFFTSVYSVFRTELAAIPAEFRRIPCHIIPWNSAEFHGIPWLFSCMEFRISPKRHI